MAEVKKGNNIQAYLAAHGKFGEAVLDAFNEVDPLPGYTADGISDPQVYLSYANRFVHLYEESPQESIRTLLTVVLPEGKEISTESLTLLTKLLERAIKSN